MKQSLRAALFVLLAATAGAALPYIARVWSWNVADTSAGLTMEVSALTDPTDAYFEYGTDAYLSGATRTALQHFSPDMTGFQANASLGGLERGTTYYFRGVTTSISGTVQGTISSFTTTGANPPVITRAWSWNIGETTAGLSMEVSAPGQSASVFFLYGPNPDLAGATRTTPTRNAPSSDPIPLQVALTGLARRTTYYFKAVAITSGGTVESPVGSFTTATPPKAQSGK